MGPYRMILVDDEAAIRRGLGLIDWAALGFTLLGSFEDGQSALAFLEENNVDVVLTDIVMPRKSGLEIAAWLHEHRPDTFVVFLSGYSDFQKAQQAIAYRVVRYLLKPTDIRALRALFLELRAQLDERAPAPPAPRETGWLCEIDRYVDAHLETGATLMAAAEYLKTSQSHLSRRFKQETGLTFTEYLIRRRLEAAKRLLKDTDLKVYEVSRRVGYWDERHFIDVFTRAEGISPAKYRKQRGDTRI